MKTTALLLSVGLSLLAGSLYGDELRRRKNAEQYAEDLTRLLDKASFKTPPPEAQLKKMAAVLNDAHKQITAVSKALKSPPPKLHKMNGRISPIRPFHKVWITKLRGASKHQPIRSMLERKSIDRRTLREPCPLFNERLGLISAIEIGIGRHKPTFYEDSSMSVAIT